MIKVTDISRDLFLNNSTILARIKKHKIPVTTIKRDMYISNEDANKINFPKIVGSKNKTISEKTKIGIISFFLTHIYYTTKELSTMLELNEYTIYKVIEDWKREDYCIIVNSKINKLSNFK